ncbi:MAG: hypothetical protein Q7S95_02745 [bacterium]|nr:hypothetical protein [bacterium]
MRGGPRHNPNFSASGRGMVLRHGYDRHDRKTRYVMVTSSVNGEELHIYILRRKNYRDFQRGHLKPFSGPNEEHLPSNARGFRISGMNLSRETATALRDALDKVLARDADM